MDTKVLAVFHALLKKGWIDRQSDHILWEYSMEPDVIDELELFQSEFGFENYRVRDRLYLIPTQDNDLFLKNNDDFKKDISGNEVRNRDIYLMNFIAIYLLYLFFNAETLDGLCRNMISEEDFIAELNYYFESYEKSESHKEDFYDYNENFSVLCNDWLSKTEGDFSTYKINTKYGTVNKLLVKLKADDIFVKDENHIIKPTQKCKDLMPYFLRKDRIADINKKLQKEGEYAAAEQNKNR